MRGADGTLVVVTARARGGGARVVRARAEARRIPVVAGDDRIGAPFLALFREMKEMRYLWRQPIRMDNARLVAVLGHEPHTALGEAVRATLDGLGCLGAQRAALPRPKPKTGTGTGTGTIA